MILSGCASSVNVVDINPIVEPTNSIATVAPTIVPMPEPTMEIIEPTPELTPEPIVVPTPEPTPFIRTTYEVPSDEYIQEEIEKLCVIDDDKKYVDYNYVYMLFEKDGVQKATCVTIPTMLESDIVVKDAFTDTDLFSFSRTDPGFVNVSDDDHSYAVNLENIKPINSYFEDAKIIKLDIIWYYWYYDMTKQYVSKEDRHEFDVKELYGTDEHSHSRQEIAYFYVKYLPEEYRINAYALFPDLEHDRKALGAKTGRE